MGIQICLNQLFDSTWGPVVVDLQIQVPEVRNGPSKNLKNLLFRVLNPYLFGQEHV